jgi:hypothetical protein
MRRMGNLQGKLLRQAARLKGQYRLNHLSVMWLWGTFSDIEGDNVTRNFVYTDSGNLPGEKHVVIMALVKVQISATEAGAGITQTKGRRFSPLVGRAEPLTFIPHQILTDRVLRTSRLCTAPA